MSPTVTPALERRCSIFADLRDLLVLALLPLLLYLATERYLPTDWYSRVTTFLSFRDRDPAMINGIVIHGMGDGSIQEITDIGTEPNIYFAAITARGGEDVQVSRPYSFIDFIFHTH